MVKPTESDASGLGNFLLESGPDVASSKPGPGQVSAPKRLRLAKIKGQFLRGPVPLRWLAIAGGQHSALLVGNALWQISGMHKNERTFQVSTVQLRPWGITKKTKRSGLAYLEKAGLIRTEQVGKRSVEVTLLCTLGEDPKRSK